ncbi:hypothetical protein, partial [Azospirillum sp. B506]|uniref:hypothetical protein n=1 Tax=Azospirillum sp. B506 TaxID=137721 RepID=UPI0035D4F5A7
MALFDWEVVGVRYADRIDREDDPAEQGDADQQRAESALRQHGHADADDDQGGEQPDQNSRRSNRVDSFAKGHCRIMPPMMAAL